MRTSYEAVARSGTATAAAGAEAVTAVVRVVAGRIHQVVVGQVGEDVEQRRPRLLLVLDHERRDSALSRVHCRGAELLARDVHAGELGHCFRPGDERERILRHDHDVEQAQRKGGAGHARAGHGEQGRDLARDERDLARELAPCVQGGDVLAELGTRRVQLADQRDAQLARESHRALHGLAATHTDRAVMLPARDPEPHHLPAVDLAQLRRCREIGARLDRRRYHAVDARIGSARAVTTRARGSA